MFQRSIRNSTLIAAVLLTLSAAARADCETDMAQLDQVLKAPSLTTDARKALLTAKKQAIAAVKTDDDVTCNKVITAALKQAGVMHAPASAAPAAVAAPSTTPSATPPATALGDLSTYKVIAADALRIMRSGDLPAAKTRIKDLETSWDQAAPRLRARNADAWKTIDKAIDRALSELRAGKPAASSSAQALTDLLVVIDTSK